MWCPTISTHFAHSAVPKAHSHCHYCPISAAPHSALCCQNEKQRLMLSIICPGLASRQSMMVFLTLRELLPTNVLSKWSPPSGSLAKDPSLRNWTSRMLIIISQSALRTGTFWDAAGMVTSFSLVCLSLASSLRPTFSTSSQRRCTGLFSGIFPLSSNIILTIFCQYFVPQHRGMLRMQRSLGYRSSAHSLGFNFKKARRCALAPPWNSWASNLIQQKWKHASPCRSSVSFGSSSWPGSSNVLARFGSFRSLSGSCSSRRRSSPLRAHSSVSLSISLCLLHAHSLSDMFRPQPVLTWHGGPPMPNLGMEFVCSSKPGELYTYTWMPAAPKGLVAHLVLIGMPLVSLTGFIMHTSRSRNSMLCSRPCSAGESVGEVVMWCSMLTTLLWWMLLTTAPFGPA